MCRSHFTRHPHGPAAYFPVICWCGFPERLLGDGAAQVTEVALLPSDPSALFFPVVVESDFVRYESKSENHRSGTIGTVVGKVKLNVGGKGLVESCSSFGTLRKQEVDVQQLMQDAVGR